MTPLLAFLVVMSLGLGSARASVEQGDSRAKIASPPSSPMRLVQLESRRITPALSAAFGAGTVAAIWYLKGKKKSKASRARRPSTHIEAVGASSCAHRGTSAPTRRASAPEVDQLFEGDLDTDGNLNMDEFVELIRSQSLGITADQAGNMFRFADDDGDGYLTRPEIKAVVSSAKEQSMQVPVRLIVPSTVGVSVAICEHSLKQRRDRVIAMLAGFFGGATAAGTEMGAYRAENGSIVYEEVVSVTSFATPEGWVKHCDAVRAAVRGFCKEWGQECMGLELEGVLEYVMVEEPSAEDLWKSVVPRLAKKAQKGMWKVSAPVRH